MKTQMPRFPFISAALVLVVIVLSATIIGDINLVELPLAFLSRVAPHEMDDILTAVAMLIAAFIVDSVIARRRTRQAVILEGERLRAVKVTMRTTQDILNDCLNQLQLLRFDAEGQVPAECLALFDEAIHETVTRLKRLADLEASTEEHMFAGAGLG